MATTDSRIKKVLFDERQIALKVKELAQRIDQHYAKDCGDGSGLVLVGILKGSYMFLSDLSRALTIPHQIDFMSVASYADTQSTGNLKIESDLRHSVKGKHVLIVEDIVDTGRTLVHLQRLLQNRQPHCVEVCSLFSKPTERKVKVDVRYCGFDLNPPEFIVGYGLDYNEHFRDLPFVGVPTSEAIEKYSIKTSQ